MSTTPRQPRKTKAKIRWSKLYSFSCWKPNVALVPSIQKFGGPGFTRIAFCNRPELHKKGEFRYPDNSISTTKYNIVTFIPRSLFEQFRRVANLYFLLAAILSLTSIAPFTPSGAIAPFVFVVGLSMLKEFVEDWHRFIQDLKVNSRKAKVHIGNGNFINKPWKALRVGDVVRVEKNQYFPSDLLLLSSSHDDGICYVETMNLDGETNLKMKRCLEATLALDSEFEFSNFEGTIRCEDPNPNLYTFIGNLEFKDQLYDLSPGQVLLRDSKLQNTEYIYGVVIFSGRDTKAIQNSTSSPSKRSRVEQKMDHVIYVLFLMLLLVSLASSIGSYVFIRFKTSDWWYIRPEIHENLFNTSKPLKSAALQLVRALILYGYLIPISLYVSIETVKFFQAMLINWDLKMYDEVACKSAEARTSNLNEELGQVEMILSDKTGTLTCNQMEFRKCSIAGMSYGGDVNEVDLAASKRMNVDFIKGFNFNDERLLDLSWMNNSNVFDTIMFFKVLALCHTGIPVEEDDLGKMKYEAESPEEVSFLVAAQEFGFKFCKRTQSTMVVKEIDPSSGLHVEREYRLLNLLEFCSSRKRMSVIVKDEDGQIFLLCKGADSIIFDRLASSGRAYEKETTQHLSDYAEDGFRTLALAYRRIKPAEYENWNSIFTRAKTTIGPEREELLKSASELIEKDLILLGVAAVEDKLQKGVPECIDKLAQAGIKIWLLTGDKKETAINIGFSCSLLRQDMKQFHLSISKDSESTNDEKIMKEELLLQIATAYLATTSEANSKKPFALVVDGKALEIALKSDMRRHFLRLAVNCASVICCRVSPKQKALITRLVKDYTGKITLAIGDGANDVGMIQAADIGVGISGMEGMQAVMASDFSLPQFRMLERLLIVHGHWCYKRITKMILYFVYKNIAFGMTLFYYELLTSFSGELLYDDWYMVLFNVILTSLPVISLGVLEQDVTAEVCLQFPALYQQGQRNNYFSWARILGWISNAVFASLAIFIFNIFALSPSTFRSSGELADLSHLGAMMYTCVIWTVNSQIALIINHFTWIHHLFIWGSIFSWYILLFIYGSLPPSISKTNFQLHKAMVSTPSYWMITFVTLVVSLLPYFIYGVVQRLFWPMDDQVIREMKHCRKDVTEAFMWAAEQKNSVRTTDIGFSARVEAKMRYWKEHLRQKRASMHGRFSKGSSPAS
ncbi:putative phospholipid-transporting ATPase 4 [Acorus gramineus]|uniref:Phospholipid-transporting ATPase n=1 Tax=Acorus gramineus TaxID=55184 RepID=A0AAV9BXI0_ACOGR|nr:putative phospholipid-transporting ATPase 4 [Acorus gramineus]